jgi:hypothetical protein
MECLSAYMEELIRTDLKQSFEFIHNYNIEHGQETESWLWEVNVLWQLGSSQDAIALFSVCVDNDPIKSKDLFIINPQLLQYIELTDLVDLSE